MTRIVKLAQLKQKYLDELSAEIDRLRAKSRTELLDRFYRLSIQQGFTHEEGVEYDAIRVVLKAVDFEQENAADA